MLGELNYWGRKTGKEAASNEEMVLNEGCENVNSAALTELIQKE
jgi:hypothetical protein